MPCYLIYLNPPYKHAAHYLGYADDVLKRLEQHRAGQGARLLQVAVEAGCKLELARIWPDGDRAFERRLHKRCNGGRLCPICKERRTGRWHNDVVFGKG